MGEVCSIKTGQGISQNMISQLPGNYPVINSGREPLGFYGKFNTENDPIGITSRGAGVGSVTWCDGQYFRGNLNYSMTIRDSNQLASRFLYHLLLNKQSDIHAKCTFNAIPALNKSDLEAISIPVPQLSVQLEIAAILDKFDVIVNDLSSGLPAEIVARRKQYEFYRDKLLTFKELEVA